MSKDDNNSKPKNWFQKHKVLTVILGVVVLGIIIGAVSGGSDGTESTNSNPTPVVSNAATPGTQNQVVTYKVGETFSPDNKVEVTIDSVQEKTQVGTQYINSQPAEGGVYVAVEWKYKNISDQPIGSFSTPSIRLLSPTGVEYDSDLSATSYYVTERKIDNSKTLSDLNPGIQVIDSKVFEVSTDLYSQPGWQVVVKNQGKEFKIDIN